MYNISLYSSIIHEKTSILAIYSSLIEDNYITEPKVFFDKKTRRQIKIAINWIRVDPSHRILKNGICIKTNMENPMKATKIHQMP